MIMDQAGLEKKIRALLKNEIEILGRIKEYTEQSDSEDDSEDPSTSNFPKTCKNCGKKYMNKKEFLKLTIPVGRKKIGSLPKLAQIYDFRSCNCGSTLMLASSDLRNKSGFGSARRELFDICLNKSIEQTGESRETIQKILRGIFIKTIRSSDSTKIDEKTFEEIE